MPAPRLSIQFSWPLASALGLSLATFIAMPAAIARDLAPIATELPLTQDPAIPKPLQPGDAFGDEVSMPERDIVFLKGKANWDQAFETLVDAFKSLKEYIAKAGLKTNGPLLTIYTSTDDSGFEFEAAAPIEKAPENPPKGDIAVTKAPAGKALKFVHRGSYDAMDSTYEAITNFLDDKRLDARDLFIEEYASDPVTSDPDRLIINVYVPVK